MRGYTRIGRGAFSSVYRKGTASTVLITSEDYTKECMSLGWFPDTPLFPNVERVEHDNQKPTYKMKFYSKVKAPKKELNTRAYELYSLLRKMFCNYSYTKPNALYDYWVNAFSKLPAKFKREKQHILAALDALSNYGSDVCFEISPRNIAKTDSGRLVLLDCFYFHSQLMEARGL